MTVMPPDIREQMKHAQPRRGGGIGAAAPENNASARARDVATEAEPEPAPAAEVEKADADELKACTRCRTKLDPEWNFCGKCGADLIRGGAAKYLGISFTEDDVHDYLFKGYVIREVSVFGKFKATLKSSQPSDIKEIDEYVMEGAWRKDKDGKERQISNFFLEQVNTLCMTAACVQKFNGESIGNTLADRMKWMFERGSALVDQLGQKAILFNRAITDHLKKADTVLGS
jgi:hypothetical protein